MHVAQSMGLMQMDCWWRRCVVSGRKGGGRGQVYLNRAVGGLRNRPLPAAAPIHGWRLLRGGPPCPHPRPRPRSFPLPSRCSSISGDGQLGPCTAWGGGGGRAAGWHCPTAPPRVARQARGERGRSGDVGRRRCGSGSVTDLRWMLVDLGLMGHWTW